MAKKQNGTEIVVAVLKIEMGHLKEMYSNNSKQVNKLLGEFKKSISHTHNRLDDHIVDAPKMMDVKDQEVRGFVWKLVTTFIAIVSVVTGMIVYFL